MASQAALLPRTGVVRRVVFVDGSQPADHFAVVELGLAVQLQNAADLVRLLDEGQPAGLHPDGPASAPPAQAVDAMLARLDALRQGEATGLR